MAVVMVIVVALKVATGAGGVRTAVVATAVVVDLHPTLVAAADGAMVPLTQSRASFTTVLRTMDRSASQARRRVFRWVLATTLRRRRWKVRS
jgi:hypothetical protein